MSGKRSVDAKKITDFAKKFVGVPYKYGATMKEAPKFFDCSSFVKYVFGHFGVEVPRSTIEQAEFLKKTVKTKRGLKIGDLLYLHGTRGYYTKKFPQGIGHVVMYIGNGKVIHAGGSGRKAGVKIGILFKVIKKGKPLVVIKRVI